MEEREIEKATDKVDPQMPHIGKDVIEHILSDAPPPLVGDINFEETPGGFEVWYSDRIANEHQDLVDQSADFLERELGVLNLGQIDYKILIADGPLTIEVRDCLIAWWRERVEDLDLGESV
jgi:hypothetical protein